MKLKPQHLMCCACREVWWSPCSPGPTGQNHVPHIHSDTVCQTGHWTHMDPSWAVYAKYLCSAALIRTCTLPSCWAWKTDLAQGSSKQLLLGFSYPRCCCWSGNKVLRIFFFFCQDLLCSHGCLLLLLVFMYWCYLHNLCFLLLISFKWMRILISQICHKSYPWGTFFIHLRHLIFISLLLFVTNLFLWVLCKVIGPKMFFLLLAPPLKEFLCP